MAAALDMDRITATETAPAAPDWPCPPFREIRSARLVLRAPSLDDVPDRFTVMSDPDSMKYWSHLPHTDIAQTEADAHKRLLADDGQSRAWAVTADGGRWLGDVSLFRQGGTPGLLWLGYMLAPVARGKGFAREAASAVLGYAFEDWGAHRVEANLDPENAASVTLLKRLGFAFEGHQRRNFLLGTEWKDTGIYGLLADEWRAARRADREAA